MTKMKSRDGYDLNEGDEIWVWSEELRLFTRHQVGKVYERKVEYTEPCLQTDYIGARLSLVYKNKPDARPDSTIVIGWNDDTI